MHDLRTPEILAWIDAMPIAERLTVMHAMSFDFPFLKNDRGWTAKAEQVRRVGVGALQASLPPAFLRIKIMKKTLWMPLFVALVAGTTIGACTSSTRTTESTGQFVDSAAITTKVKTAMIKEPGLKSMNISVDTFKDGVQLSGVVDSDQAKARAAQVAASVPGVKSVQNDLIVK